MSINDVAKEGRKYGAALRYAQGPASVRFKDALRLRLKKAIENDSVESFLDDVHDSVLTAMNAKHRPSALDDAANRLDRGSL